MATLVGILILVAPFALVAGVAALIERRHARRRGEILRQVALTDALHARLGAVVAPLVRRRGRRWHVAVAVPFERPAIVADVLDLADAQLRHEGYEVALTPQAPPVPPRTARAVLQERESLSWT